MTSRTRQRSRLIVLSLAACAAWTIGASFAGPIHVRHFDPEVKSDTDLATTGSLLIEGLHKKTDKCPSDWQSSRILLSCAGMPDGVTARGKLDIDEQILELQQGWAYVSVSCAPAPVQNLVGEVLIVRPWHFINVNGIGAGAEGTDFYVEHTADGAIFYSDSTNSSRVLITVPRADGKGQDFKIYRGRFVEITGGPGAFSINGTALTSIDHKDEAIEPPVLAANRRAELEASLKRPTQERARVGH